ncbi:MAG: aminoacyl-tRNA deacylase [Microbacterium sp. 69-10]|uniref:YbaK/EbsC family protein n=1 Tax=Microbacterium sp. 69-10 TaxID=1895783 RepID=UPI000965D7E0|nr:YbaK/EbsC family protein [Microbacterium sp. 69-10]OJU42005.1 MAG: aminoacyl-tRNA deacylase [Microbacterium sp. 69-10]
MNAPDDLPARSRLVHEHLAAAGVDSAIVVLPDSARTAALAAAAIGCEVGAIGNSLVLVADGEPVLVMTSGAHRVDFGVLARSIGADAVAMAPADVVREATGQVIGGVAPVGHPTRLRTYLDEDLRGFAQVWTAGGTPHTVMPLTFAQLESLTGGEMIRVA